MADLTPKQLAFVEQYLIDLNGTAAAIRAGYSERSASEQAHQLLQKPAIQEALREALEARSKRVELTQDYVLKSLHSVAERSMQAEAVLDREGNPTGEYTFNASGANKALELLGKHLGMFKERVEISRNYVVEMPAPAESTDAWLAQIKR